MMTMEISSMPPATTTGDEPGNRFLVTAAVPRLNWGRAQMMFAIRVAMIQPQPITGLKCRLTS